VNNQTTYEYISKPQGKILAQYTADESDVVVIIGPLGSGKTVETCQKLFNLMCDQTPDAEGKRKSRWLAIRNTYRDLSGTTIKDWIELYGDLGRYTGGGSAPPTHRLKFELDDKTVVEAELIFLALDRGDAEKKLRGYQLTGVWCNEIRELDKRIFDMALARCGRYPAKPRWYGLIGDSNAPDVDHWLYNLAEKETPEDWKFYKQPGGLKSIGVTQTGRINWIKNPDAENINNLPKNYYSKNMRGKSDDWIAVNLANQYGFVSDGKAIYPEYRDDFHCHEVEFIPDLPIIRGWDFGKAACVLHQHTKHGQLIAQKEYTSNQTMGIDRFSDFVINDCAQLIVDGYEFIDIGDPSGKAGSLQSDGITCFTILEDKGIDIQAGKQDPKIRIESVRYFLGRLVDGLPAFIVNGKQCPVLRKGFQGAYCFRRMQVAGERYADKPDKGDASHPHDCTQYVAAYLRSGYVEEEEDDDWDDYEDDGRDSTTGY